MTFKIGDKVVYPSQGPCRIDAVVEKEIAGAPATCYRLTLLDDSHDAVLVPVEKILALSIRHLLAKSEIPKLLGHFKKSPAASKNWKQRAIDNTKLLASGSAFDLVEVVESLTQLSQSKALLPRDRQTLNKARNFLICEIAEVMGESWDAAEEELDRALEGTKTRRRSTPAYAPIPDRHRAI
jgi:CarD family transcriptional regulator, regulator of rRNA transcription